MDPRALHLDTKTIEAAITDRTTAIQPMHRYRNYCEIQRILLMADTYGLKLIYDSARALGVRYLHQSLVRANGLTILSFSSQKVSIAVETAGVLVGLIPRQNKRLYR